MPPNIVRHVQIILSVVNRGQQNGIVAMTRGFQEMMRLIRNMQTGFMVAQRAVSFFLDTQKHFEDYKLSMAGLINAHKLSDNFGHAVKLADAFVSRMRDAAAVLPGELNEYMEVSSRAYAAIAKARFPTIERQVDFLSKYTAITHSLGIESKTAGRNLFQMLTGSQRITTQAWTKMSPLLNKKDRDNWKSLTVEQRAAALYKVFDKFKPMLEASMNTWDSIGGTFKSTVQQIAMLASDDAFAGLKDVFKDINHYMSENRRFMADMVRSAVKLGLVMSLGMLASGGMRWMTAGTALGGAQGLGLLAALRTPLAANMTARGLTVAAPITNAMGVQTGSQIIAILSLMNVIRWSAIALAITALASFGAAYATNTGGIRTDMENMSVAIGTAFGDMEGLGHMFSKDGVIGGFFMYTLPSVISSMVTMLTVAMLGMKSYAKWAGTGLDTWGKQGQLGEEIAKRRGLVFDRSFLGDNPFGVKKYGVPLGGPMSKYTLTPLEQSNRNQAFAEWNAKKKEYESLGSISNDVEDEALMAIDAARDRQNKLNDVNKIKQPKDRSSSVVNMFNPQFNILQQFDAGADPDRILTGFVDSVVALSHRRIESSFSPMGP